MTASTSTVNSNGQDRNNRQIWLLKLHVGQESSLQSKCLTATLWRTRNNAVDCKKVSKHFHTLRPSLFCINKYMSSPQIYSGQHDYDIFAPPITPAVFCHLIIMVNWPLKNSQYWEVMNYCCIGSGKHQKQFVFAHTIFIWKTWLLTSVQLCWAKKICFQKNDIS